MNYDYPAAIHTKKKFILLYENKATCYKSDERHDFKLFMGSFTVSSLLTGHSAIGFLLV